MDLSKRNMKKLMILITFGIGLFWALTNLSDILAFFSHALHLLFPFIL